MAAKRVTRRLSVARPRERRETKGERWQFDIRFTQCALQQTAKPPARTLAPTHPNPDPNPNPNPTRPYPSLTLTLTLSLSLGLTLSLSLTRCDGLSGLGDLGKNRGSVEGEVCVQS